MTTVYVTAPPDAGARIAQTLVDERLAACVNRLPCTSTYRWDGEVHHDDEEILLIKTEAERYDELQERLLELHPASVPCIERFGETDVLESFGEWRAEAVGLSYEDPE